MILHSTIRVLFCFISCSVEDSILLLTASAFLSPSVVTGLLGCVCSLSDKCEGLKFCHPLAGRAGKAGRAVSSVPGVSEPFLLR